MVQMICEKDFAKGLDVIRWIAENNETIWPNQILLKDGDTVALDARSARGVLLIHSKLNPENQLKMNELDVLHLLHILDVSTSEGVLKLDDYKLYPR